MKANLYLHPEKFRYNGVDTWEEFSDKLNCLANDMCAVINDYSGDNQFKVYPSLFLTPVYEERTIYEVIPQCLEPDEMNIMYSMLSNTSEEEDEISIGDLKSKCFYTSEEKEVNSVVVLNNPTHVVEDHQTVVDDYITFDYYSVVYNKDTWYTLRRQILGNHPGTSREFVEGCRICFPDIVFHDNCIDTLKCPEYDFLIICPRRIVYYLSCLNDKFSEFADKYIAGKMDPNNLLENFSGTYAFDEAGSMQQNYTKKELLTFDFTVTDGVRREIPLKDKVLCEPHFKIAKPDSNYRGSSVKKDFHPRIYFNFERKKRIENGKYLVGQMGKHVQ